MFAKIRERNALLTYVFRPTECAKTNVHVICIAPYYRKCCYSAKIGTFYKDHTVLPATEHES